MSIAAFRALALASTTLLAPALASAQSGGYWVAGFDSRESPTAQQMQRVQDNSPRPEFFLGPRWSGSQGSPRVVTWSLATDGITIPSLIGENQAQNSLFARMDVLFASQGGRATWVQRIQETFDRWEALSGIDFVRVTAPGVDWDDGASWGSLGGATRGDIRIAMKRLDQVGGVTVVSTFPGVGDIVLDRAEDWSDPTNLHRFLRNTLAWGTGIASGLDLSCPQDGTKLMEPAIQFGFDGPQQDDIRAIQRHYGDPFESDDAPGAPNALGTIPVGTGVSLGALPPPLVGASDPNSALLSIDAAGESDWFQFSVPVQAVATVHVLPIGSTYLNAPNGAGGCSGSAPFDALAAADLQFELVSSDGVTVLASASSAAAGSGESLVLFPLPGAGTFYVRVTEAGSFVGLQAYTFDLGISGCTVDSDGDGTADCSDGCPLDPAKIAPGVCGCGVVDVDSDGDGTYDCHDGCPNDPAKIAVGQCGCGNPDIDSDGDGTSDCIDGCPNDPLKTSVGFCGCGLPETDTDGDGTPDCADQCPIDPLKIAPGTCGCGTPDIDSDGDGTPDCNDQCPNDPFKVAPGTCGCGVPDIDTDGDGVLNCNDGCPNDPLKTSPGVCGCGLPDVDSDGDGTLDCFDGCPNDPLKTSPGICGCGAADVDSDGDGTADCFDQCPNDPLKVLPGACGCGVVDLDSDSDGVEDCNDNCPQLFNPLQVDFDGDGRGDDCDNCPNHVNPGQADCDNDGQGDVCTIALGLDDDCDLNGVPDGCEPDCNQNGRVDACDILLGTSLDLNADAIPDDCQAPCPAIQSYCTGKVNSAGCVPTFGWSGVPSVSVPSGFTLTCINAIPGRAGQLFYGYAQSTAPFQGGYLCVRPPLRRTALQLATGTTGCNGQYSFDFNTWIATGNDVLLTPGLNVFARWWMRDPGATFTTGFSNSVSFTICP